LRRLGVIYSYQRQGHGAEEDEMSETRQTQAEAVAARCGDDGSQWAAAEAAAARAAAVEAAEAAAAWDIVEAAARCADCVSR
jgi:hypothetical protein